MMDLQPTSGVYVLSGPVQTGKTTRLRAWCAEQLSQSRADGSPPVVDGILAPVVHGHRHLLRVQTGVLRDLEDISDGAATVTVRRFTFNEEVFAWARSALLGAAQPAPPEVTLPRWTIVDEIGPLELAGGGLEPAVSDMLQRVGFGRRDNATQTIIGDKLNRSADSGTRVVLVIRENLVDDVLKHFGLSSQNVHRFPFA
jgi:nucleoside-triphosphatase